MKKYKKIFLSALFLASPLLANIAENPENVERVLTEEACVKLALSVNHDILIYKQSILLAEQKTKEAQALHYPNMDFNLNGSRFSNDVPTVISAKSLPTSLYLPSGNRDFAYSARVSLWQNIYNGGKTVATNKLAKMNLSQVKNDSDIKTNEIITKVKIQFYKNLALKEKIAAYSKQMSSLSKNEKKYKNEIEYVQNQLDITKHQYEIETLELLGLMGLSLDTTIDLTGDMGFFKLDLNLQQCVLWAYQFRQEMKNTQYQETIDSISVNLLTMEKYPTVMLGASYDWMGTSEDTHEKDWYVSLNINYPIFDGGTLFTKIKQKKIKARQATIERSKTEERIKLEVRKAYSEYNFWYNKALKLQNAKKSSQSLDKEIAEIDTLYSYLKSLFELELAIGKQITAQDLKYFK